MHDWLEEIVITPHLIIQAIHLLTLVSFSPPLTKILTHQGVIFLFHHASIIFVIRTASTEPKPSDFFPPKADQMLIEKLTPVIRMQLFDWKGETMENMPKTNFHCTLTPAKHCHTLTPSRGHIDHL
jgi:hypothetical protein